jgi:hypothetical protein
MPIAEQMRHKRIGIGDLPADRIQNKHTVVRGLKKPAVADFRLPDSNTECRVFG